MPFASVSTMIRPRGAARGGRADRRAVRSRRGGSAPGHARSLPAAPPLAALVPALLVAAGCGAGGPAPDTAADGDADAAASADSTYIAEVEALAADPRVQAALDHIVETDDRTVQDMIFLTEIPAPPFMEERRGQAYIELLREAGADSVWIDEEGNAIGLRRGTAGDSTLVVSGHLDTVFPEGTDVTVRQSGDTLYAPGIGDDVRGLAAVLAVLRAMEAVDLRTEADILFVGTVGEEGLGDLRGVKHLFREGGPRIDWFISVDGSSDSRVTHQGLGSRRYRVTFTGPGGHSWGAFGTANPAHALGRAIRMFDEAADAFTASGARTSYNVGRIGGGTSINSVPFEAWMEVDMRSLSQARLLEIDSIFRATMEQALELQNQVHRRGEPLEADVALVGDRPSGEIPVSNPFIQRAMAATQFIGREPGLGRSSTDSNTPISLGIPAVTLGGGGDGGDSHALTEWWVNEDGAAGIHRILLLVLAQAGLAGAAT